MKLEIPSDIRQLAQNGSHIYCDMDGVLVNFSKGAYELFGRLIFGNESTFTNSEVEHYIRYVGSNISKIDFSSEAFRYALYSAMGENPGKFFSGLEPLNDGTDVLWPYLHGLKLPVHVLTAPINNNIPNVGMTAEDGKKAWCDKWLTPKPLNVYVTPAKLKPYFAVNKDTGAPNILIDDRSSTIESWRARGGIGFLHIPGDSNATIKAIQTALFRSH